MTRYDRMIDTIVNLIYNEVNSTDRSGWCEDSAKDTAENILEVVESYQSTPVKLPRWRASD